jgi:hypothetical protein
MMRHLARSFRSRTPFLGGLLFLWACGGSGAPVNPAPPVVPATAPAESMPGTDPRPETPDAAADQSPGPTVYGVDLDTVQAGRFDQGKMWTFEFPPREYLAETYGLRPDDAWFEKARLGALRIPSCSASFVSPHGLVMTNHHCAREFVSQVSGEGESLLDDGLVATDLSDERPIDDFEADRLLAIVDVTDEVNDSGHVVEMISLYNGGRTSAYVFRRFTNAKLVMAPELQIGFFGGDPDNFTYPRYNLDFAFFRIYDDEGQPLQSDPYFAFDQDGLEDGDPIFIIGNPGSTNRLQTVAQLEFRRDVSDRGVIELLRTRMAVLDAYISAHPEEAEERDLRNTYFSLANSLKAYGGQVSGLEDPVIIARRRDTERDFQSEIDADSALAGRYGALIDQMAELQDRKREQGPGFGAFLAMTSADMESSTLHRALISFQILSARQSGSPAEAVEGLVEALSAVPDQAPELDQALMEARFRDFAKFYGDDAPLVSAVLGGQSVEAKAAAVVSTSQLQDSATAVAGIADGSIGIADPALGVVRSYLPAFIAFQQVVAGVFPEEEQIASELGRARFEVYGTDVPPDATFSLRIADGAVGGYAYNGTQAPAFTTMFGLFDRHFSHAGDDDWALPTRWLEARSELELSTPMNFVSTADIIGGNSGSPVLDADLEVVGVVFDGNIESLPGEYIYLPEQNRSVTVDARAILEALDVVYDMDRLVHELTSGELIETEQAADARGR